MAIGHRHRHRHPPFCPVSELVSEPASQPELLHRAQIDPLKIGDSLLIPPGPRD
jgi:hypothetical protein